MNHDGHDHSAHQGHDHSGHGSHDHMNHDPVTSTAATIVQKVVENVTQIVQQLVETTTTADPHAGHHGHDHSAHVAAATVEDHSGHGAHGGHEMKMYFHGGSQEVILFDCWRINSCLGLIISCVLIFLMGAAYEGIKWFRIYLELKESRKTLRRRPLSPGAAVSMNGNKSPSSPEKVVITLPTNSHNDSLLGHSNTDNDNQVYAPTVKKYDSDAASVGFFNFANVRRKAVAQHRIIEAALYCVQVTVAYFLMLIAMTYNTYLTAAVVLGAGFGHWLFALIQEASVSANAETVDAISSDACH